MIPTIISLLSLGGNTFGALSSIKQGRQVDQIVKLLSEMNWDIKRLSDNVFYAPNIQVMLDTNRSSQQIVDNLIEVQQALDPLQRALGSPILSSSLIITPDLMQRALSVDPWESLIDIRPIDRVKPPPDPNMIAFSFQHKNESYVGWQKAKILPQIFGFEYRQNLWLPKGNSEKQIETSARLVFPPSEPDNFSSCLSNNDLIRIMEDHRGLLRFRAAQTWKLYYFGRPIVVEGILHYFTPKKLELRAAIETIMLYHIKAELSEPLGYELYSKLKHGSKLKVMGMINYFSFTFLDSCPKLELKNCKVILSD